MISGKLDNLTKYQLTPLDLLVGDGLQEKIVSLILNGVSSQLPEIARNQLKEVQKHLLQTPVDDSNVVVFGGGSGLSNIIGGDSRHPDWPKNPFAGLKRIFPNTRSVVCVTDNGGSTGELLKDLQLIALGDIRHVLLSSIQLIRLQQQYRVSPSKAAEVTAALAQIFNWRFEGPLSSEHHQWSSIKSSFRELPLTLGNYLNDLSDFLFRENRFKKTLQRSHCFGNLLLAAAIYQKKTTADTGDTHQAILEGLSTLADHLGAGRRAVLPCTSTPAQLRILYTNGVEIPGEHKLSSVKRGVPVSSAEVDYCGKVRVFDEVIADILEADIIVLAPGSLYSSIIPVFKVPGLADAVRRNKKALKVLVSNLWVQAGETDLSNADPERKFHVSDMIRAYEENIPGGTAGLFNKVLCVSMKEIPASILQSYGVEGKIPIYLDREKLLAENFIAVESEIYSREAIVSRGVIQHDPGMLALAIKGLLLAQPFLRSQGKAAAGSLKESTNRTAEQIINEGCLLPCIRYQQIKDRISNLELVYLGEKKQWHSDRYRADIIEILWDNPVIPLAHLCYFTGIHCIDPGLWNRDQKWDNVFSFYDPEDRCLKIRADQLDSRPRLEVALMIALGESLLGNYAANKEMKKVIADGIDVGNIYHLHLRSEANMRCFFDQQQLRTFLHLSRMSRTADRQHYTRLVNKGEGFTPPGLLMGLMYAWYVDNRLATHIEYKMSVLKINRTDLIPEQLKMASRRKDSIDFFREVVFK